MACCEAGYALDFRTFVLQGGEDGYWTDDRLVALVAAIRRHFPDCAITLSIGERSRASYQRLFDAGADRYLLRHETACPAHYRRLHPPEMRWENRLRCLRDLLEIGYQTGCGMMVGTPGQTVQTLVRDMQLLQQLRPQMVGIGPFLPHRDTAAAARRTASGDDGLGYGGGRRQEAGRPGWVQCRDAESIAAGGAEKIYAL